MTFIYIIVLFLWCRVASFFFSVFTKYFVFYFHEYMLLVRGASSENVCMLSCVWTMGWLVCQPPWFIHTTLFFMTLCCICILMGTVQLFIRIFVYSVDYCKKFGPTLKFEVPSFSFSALSWLSCLDFSWLWLSLEVTI